MKSYRGAVLLSLVMGLLSYPHPPPPRPTAAEVTPEADRARLERIALEPSGDAFTAYDAARMARMILTLQDRVSELERRSADAVQ